MPPKAKAAEEPARTQTKTKTAAALPPKAKAAPVEAVEVVSKAMRVVVAPKAKAAEVPTRTQTKTKTAAAAAVPPKAKAAPVEAVEVVSESAHGRTVVTQTEWEVVVIDREQEAQKTKADEELRAKIKKLAGLQHILDKFSVSSSFLYVGSP